mmetsp:Transcript_46294/g.138389  ORF Transcript_46294/g.138389 Transcript_46294/m.138389 type:complete len:234 (-) Transcript_46294:901-1602(-)
MPFCWTCARRALATACCASWATCFRAPRRAFICFLHLESSAPTFTFSLTKLLLASLKGPDWEVLISSMRSLMLACVFSMDCSAASKPCSASSMAFSGFSSSLPRSATSVSAAGNAASTAEVLEVTRASTSAIMAAQIFRWAASCRFFRSASTRWLMRFSKSTTFFLICERVYCTLLTRGLSLASSAFVSARGPARTAFSSSAFCSRYLPASLAASARSSSAFSVFFWSATCGE